MAAATVQDTQGAANFQPKVQQLTAFSRFRSQVRSHPLAEFPSQNRTELLGEQVTPYSRRLRYRYSGQMQRTASYSFRQLGSHERCPHSSCIDRNPGAYLHPGQCSPPDRNLSQTARPNRCRLVQPT